MAEDGFVVHFPDERRWGLGISAFEIGSAFLRHDPLQRLAQPILGRVMRRLPANLPAVAHCSVLHGRESFYIARSSSVRALSIVAEVGVRLPASLTASGRSMLCVLPASQIRALFPDGSAFIDRTGNGPTSLTALSRILAVERRQGFSVEDGMVTPGFLTIAKSSIDRWERPAASVGITVKSEEFSATTRELLVSAVTRAALDLSHQLGPR